MRLTGRREALLDTNVQLLRAAPEPNPSARRQRLRLRNLFETAELTEESPRVVLAACRRGELNMVDRFDHSLAMETICDTPTDSLEVDST